MYYNNTIHVYTYYYQKLLTAHVHHSVCAIITVHDTLCMSVIPCFTVSVVLWTALSMAASPLSLSSDRASTNSSYHSQTQTHTLAYSYTDYHQYVSLHYTSLGNNKLALQMKQNTNAVFSVPYCSTLAVISAMPVSYTLILLIHVHMYMYIHLYAHVHVDV